MADGPFGTANVVYKEMKSKLELNCKKNLNFANESEGEMRTRRPEIR